MKYFLFALILFGFSACHESLEERADRESKDFTRKNCPMPVSDEIIVDSMKYEKTTHTIHYFYSIKGLADTTAITKFNPKKELLQGLKDDTNLRKYKEAGFNFAYTYFSTKNKGLILVDARFTPKDYGSAK